MPSTDLSDQLQAALGTAYVVERELAGGGMSRVFVVQESALGRRIVVKMLLPELAAGVSAERFQREIRLAAALQHPHIVPLLAVGDSSGLPYYSMPFVTGESLRQRLARSGELPVAEAVRILRDVADALVFAHGHGIVHRDIKPENVLLSGEHALVADFGVAKAMSEAAPGHTLTSVGVAIGTPTYMAPEQAAADPSVDQRADIYAFGVLAYEMLVGAPPFHGRPPAQLLAAHATEPPVPLDRARPAVPAPLAALVMRCLEKRPADRPQSAIEVFTALGTTAVSGEVPASAHGKPAIDSGRFRRRTTVTATAVIALALATLAWQRLHGTSATPRRVAVAPFENLTNDTSLTQVGRIAADWITQGIAQTDSVAVVSSVTVMGALADAAHPTRDVVRRLGAATHATVVITGSVARLGDSLRVSAEIVDAKSGQVIRALQPVSGPVADPLVSIQALRERLLGSFASGDLERRVRLGGDPPKYSAYRDYIEGTDRFFRYRDWAGAERFFTKAIQLDSTFAVAWTALAIAYSNGGQLDQADSIVTRAELLRDRLTPDDRLQLVYIREWITRDDEAALRTAMQITERDSSMEWLYSLGLNASRLLRPRLAIPALRAADSGAIAAGWQNPTNILGSAYHEAGDYRSELSTFERGRRAFPTNTTFAPHELAAFAGLAQPVPALRLADTVLAAVPASPVAVLTAVLAGATEFAAHGDAATGQRLARMVVTWFGSHAVASSPSIEFARGRAFYIVGTLDSAAAHFQLAGRDTSMADVRAKRFTRARARVSLLDFVRVF